MNKNTKSRVVSGQLHPLSIIRMVWKHKLGIVIVTALLTAGSVAVIRQLPAVYEADALILVDSQKIPEKFVSSTVQVSLQDSLNAISHLVLSSHQLQAIIDDLGLYKDLRETKTPEEIIDRMRDSDLTIKPERGLSGDRGGAFRITYQGKDPNVVAKVVMRIADLYIRENTVKREERAVGTSEFIDQQLKKSKESLDQQEATLSQYKLKWTGELPQQEQALLATLNRLQQDLQANGEAIERAHQNNLLLDNTRQLAEASLAADNRAIAQARQASAQPRIEPAAAPGAPEIKPSDQVRAQLAAAKLRYYDDHPEVKRLQRELDRLLALEAAADPKPVVNPAKAAAPTAPVRAEIEVPGGTPMATLIEERNRDTERVTTTKTQIELVSREIATRNAEAVRIQRSIDDYQKRVEALPVREQQLAGLTRDYEISKANYGSLLDKKMSAQLAMQMEMGQESERFTIADPAHVPEKPVKPHRTMLCAVAGMGSLLLCLAIAFAVEWKKDVFLGEWELPPNLVVLGRVAAIKPPAGGAPRRRIAAVTPVAILIVSSAAAVAGWLARMYGHV